MQLSKLSTTVICQLETVRNLSVIDNVCHVSKVQPSVSIVSTNPIDERIAKLTRMIDGCKKKIVTYETEFERRTGTKPNQHDRTNDTTLRKLYGELSKLKREQRHLTEISSTSYNSKKSTAATTLMTTVKEIETVSTHTLKSMWQRCAICQKRLKLTRETASRDGVDHLTETQLVEEKIATQKALLYLESVHGRPQSKRDRDLVRPFYDRYRLLKQTILKTSNVSTTHITIDAVKTVRPVNCQLSNVGRTVKRLN